MQRGRLLLPRGRGGKKKKRDPIQDRVNIDKLKKGVWLTVRANLQALIPSTAWNKAIEQVLHIYWLINAC